MTDTPASTPLDSLVDAGAFLSHEHQIRLQEVLGDGWSWGMDTQAGLLTFTGPHPLQTSVQVLGSTAPGPGTWLWAWANPSLPEPLTALTRNLRAYGEQHSIREFSDAEQPLQGEIPWLRVTVAALALDPWPTTYFPAPMGGGSQAILVFSHPELTLAPLDVPRFARVIGEVTSGFALTSHRRAVLAWMSARGIPVNQTETTAHVQLAGGDATVTFDELDRITNVQGSAGPTN